jgi:hypothetical protein
MSRRTDNQPDRGISENRSVVFLILVILVALGTGIFVSRYIEWDSSSLNDVQERGDATGSTPYDPLMVTLYLPFEGMLRMTEAPLKRQPDTQAQMRESLLALFGDSQRAQTPILKDLRFKEVFFESSGTAYVDLAPLHENIRGSAWDEVLALYAVVHTLTLNFDEVRQVRFLIQGREAGTLAGHIDLVRKFTKRTDLVFPDR